MEGAAMLQDFVAPIEPSRVIVPPMTHTFTLDKLWDLAPSQHKGRI
jgi:hypothetical protein